MLWASSADKLNDPFEAAVAFYPDRLLVEDESDAEFVASMERKMAAGTLQYEEPLKKPVQLREIWRRNTEVTLGDFYGERTEEVIEIFAKINAERNQKLVRELTAGIRKNMSVLSLSAEPTSSLMWSHYSSSHTGFLIEYDFHSLSPSDERRKDCFPVFYTKKLRDITRYIRTGRPDQNVYFFHYISLIKHADWAYEREWRYIQTHRWQKPTFELSMPQPSAIVLGARVSDQDAAWMADFCKRRSIPIKQAAQTTGTFELTITDYGM